MMTHDKLTGLFKLGTITLAFPGTTSTQEDVLGVTVDILLPMGKPSHCVIMLDTLPLTGNVGHRDRSFFANVDNDIFRSETVLWTDTSGNQRNASDTITELTLTVPFLGCSPRPLNNPGGSARKLPTFSFLPSTFA